MSSTSVGPKGYRCLAPDCDYKTDRHTDLNRHYRAKHSCPQEEMYSCSYKGCTKDFKRKDHLRDHCKRVHDRDLPVEMGGTGGRLRSRKSPNRSHNNTLFQVDRDNSDEAYGSDEDRKAPSLDEVLESDEDARQPQTAL